MRRTFQVRFPKKSLLAPLRVWNRALSGSEIDEQRLGGGGAKETPSELRCSQTASVVQWRITAQTQQVAPSQVNPALSSEDLHVRMFGAGANQAPILFNVASHRAPVIANSRDENLMDPTRDGDRDGPKFLPVWAWLRWSTLKAGTDPGLSSPPLSSGRTD